MFPASRFSTIVLTLVALLLGGCVGQPTRPPPATAAQANETTQVTSRQVPAAPTGKPPSDTQAPKPPVDDLWARLRSGFALGPVAGPEIAGQLEWLRQHPEHVERVVHRARPFLWFIVQRVDAHRLPLELALLPAVESGFRPEARSRFGAAGLWQIMPATARALGLESTPWYDSRLDPLASTEAALTYLELMHRSFHGDWLLALAAYNAGPGVIRKAIARNRAHGEPTAYRYLHLPPQTRNYIPRLLALAQVIAHPEAHGIRLAPLPNEPLLSSVQIPRPMDLAVAAKLAHIGLRTLRDLNPAYRGRATPPEGGHGLLLPRKAAADFSRRLARLAPDRYLRGHRYAVVVGDNLWTIARKHGISVTDLRQANALTHDRLRIGQRLLIPGPGGAPKRPTARRPHYVVRPGDNLWNIARRLGLDHRRLAAWNGLSLDRPLQPGQRLLIYPRL